MNDYENVTLLGLLQETEGGINGGKLDQRTRCRIVDRCLATGQLQRLLIQLPGKRLRHKGFYEEVLARADIKLDSTFLHEVSLLGTP